jgi:hypothetical protein
MHTRQLKHQLEIKTGRPYSWAEIARESTVQINTVKNIANNKTGRVDLDNVSKLMRFFASQGMPITVSDFFIVTTE